MGYHISDNNAKESRLDLHDRAQCHEYNTTSMVVISTTFVAYDNCFC